MKKIEPHRFADLFGILMLSFTVLTMAIVSCSAAARADDTDDQAEALLEVMLRRPRWHEDLKEPLAERRARLGGLAVTMIRTADAKVAEPDPDLRFNGSTEELLALLLTAGYWESRFASHVHRGECRKRECDGGRAKSVYQLQAERFDGVLPDAEWDAIKGADPESDRIATNGAANALIGAWKHCKHRHGIEGIWSGYMKGYCRLSPQSKMRTRFYLKMLGEIRRAL